MTAVEMTAPDWVADAECATGGYPPDLFWPDTPDDETLALDVCARCAHADDCLLWALDCEQRTARGERPWRFGIFGGTRPQERKQLARALTDARPEDRAVFLAAWRSAG